MKTVNKINYFFLSLTVLLGLAGIFDDEFLYYFLISFIPIGIYQVGVAIFYSTQFNGNFHYKTYTYLVMLFFSLAFTSQFWWDYLEPYGGIICGLPPILAIYFSIILHDKSKTL